MHPRLTELFAYIDAQHAQVRAAYDAVPEPRRSVRPAPEQWSTTDIVGHLTLTERRIAGLFVAKIAAARGAGIAAESDESPVLPTIDVTPVLDRRTKIVAPELARPAVLAEPATWADYEQARAQLKAAVLTGDGLALSQISHPHPIFGPLDLYTWTAFAGAHALRHAEQIREASAAAG